LVLYKNSFQYINSKPFQKVYSDLSKISEKEFENLNYNSEDDEETKLTLQETTLDKNVFYVNLYFIRVKLFQNPTM